MTTRSLLELRPHGGFGLILADPPWQYAYRNQETGKHRGPDSHYDCMSLEAIKALPVAMVAARDCVLWLWTTGPHIDHALEVLEAWGFRYSTLGVWAKTKKDDPTELRMGTGYRHRGVAEFYRIGVRGEPPCLDRGIRGGILEPPREHSRKPDSSYDLAARYVAPGTPRLELFARQRRPGWAAWGAELDHFPSLTAAPAAAIAAE